MRGKYYILWIGLSLALLATAGVSVRPGCSTALSSHCGAMAPCSGTDVEPWASHDLGDTAKVTLSADGHPALPCCRLPGCVSDPQPRISGFHFALPPLALFRQAVVPRAGPGEIPPTCPVLGERVPIYTLHQSFLC